MISIEQLGTIVQNAAEVAEARMAVSLANISTGGSGPMAAASGSTPSSYTTNGQYVPNPGNLNGDLDPSDPGYNPLLDQLPAVFIAYWRLGEPVGSAPLAPTP